VFLEVTQTISWHVYANLTYFLAVFFTLKSLANTKRNQTHYKHSAVECCSLADKILEFHNYTFRTQQCSLWRIDIHKCRGETVFAPLGIVSPHFFQLMNLIITSAASLLKRISLMLRAVRWDSQTNKR